MKKTPDENTPQSASVTATATKTTTGQRNGLRLVSPIVEETPPPAPVTKRKSQLAAFLSAYADAIDNDIKAIMDV